MAVRLTGTILVLLPLDHYVLSFAYANRRRPVRDGLIAKNTNLYIITTLLVCYLISLILGRKRNHVQTQKKKFMVVVSGRLIEGPMGVFFFSGHGQRFLEGRSNSAGNGLRNDQRR